MALILIGFALIALIDLPPIVRKRSGRGAAAFLLLFITALTISVLQASSIEVPSILHLIGSAFKAVGLSY